MFAILVIVMYGLVCAVLFAGYYYGIKDGTLETSSRKLTILSIIMWPVTYIVWLICTMYVHCSKNF